MPTVPRKKDRLPPVDNLDSYRIKREDLTQMRTALVALDAAAGSKVTEIAREYNIPESRVKQMLSLAEQEGFIEHFRRVGYEKLMGKVWAVYDLHLQAGNLQAARDLAYGLRILEQDKVGKELKGQAVQTLDQWRERRAEREKKTEGGGLDAPKLERPH